MIHIQAQVDINRSVDEVFDFFEDPENRLQWQLGLVQHQHEPLFVGAAVTEVRNMLGKRLELSGEIVEYEHNRAIGFSGRGPVVTSIGYHHRFEAVGHRTRVFVEVHFEPNQRINVSRRLVESIVRRDVEHSLEYLKDVLENAEEARHLHAALPRHHHQVAQDEGAAKT